MNNIYFDLKIKSGVYRIYSAVSDPKELLKWWPLECSGNAEIDEVYRLFFGELYDWRARVSKMEVGRIFEWTMEDCDEDWNGTKVGFIVTPEDSEFGMLSFYHTGWPTLNHHFRHSAFCWANLLEGLKNYLETGVVQPFELRA